MVIGNQQGGFCRWCLVESIFTQQKLPPSSYAHSLKIVPWDVQVLPHPSCVHITRFLPVDALLVHPDEFWAFPPYGYSCLLAGHASAACSGPAGQLAMVAREEITDRRKKQALPRNYASDGRVFLGASGEWCTAILILLLDEEGNSNADRGAGS